MEGKIIVISAPSGCGKSTIIKKLTEIGTIDFEFSVSATSRPPREGEIHGQHYWFLSETEFRDAISRDEFVEYEEVYPGRFYGTLKSELQNKCDNGKNIILDIDVKGAINVKNSFGNRALTVFIEPPSIEELKKRLENRGTETEDTLNARIGKAEFELSFAPRFDVRIVNDDLDTAVRQTEKIIKEFIGG